MKCQSNLFSQPLKGTTAGTEQKTTRTQDHRIPHCFLVLSIPDLCAVEREIHSSGPVTNNMDANQCCSL